MICHVQLKEGKKARRPVEEVNWLAEAALPADLLPPKQENSDMSKVCSVCLLVP